MTRWTMVSVALIVFAPGSALAVEPYTPEPQTVDGTIDLKTDSVGIVVGYRWGSGVLHYRGKDYDFSIEGLSIGDLGAARADASGNVYNLKSLDDFNGTYKGATANLTIVGGSGGNELTNEKGVKLHLSRTTVGLKLKVGVDGVKMTLKERP